MTATRPTAESRIKAALWFAERGFGVFSVWSTVNGVCRCRDGAACHSPGKHPIGDHGFQEATRDPDRIRTLLSAGSNPNYGLVNPEGVFAWDLDGPEWRERLAGLETSHGALPPTLTTETANGEHRFLRWPEGFPRPIGQLFGWVTRWGSGRDAGYVIGPRSIHPSGREYVPGVMFDIATLPVSWAEAILEELRPTRPGVIEVTAGGYQLPAFGYTGSRYDAIRNYQASRYMRGLVRDEIYVSGFTVLNPRFAQPLSEGDYLSRFDRAWDKMIERLGEPNPPPDEQEPSGEVRRARDDDELDFVSPPAAGEFPPDPDEIAYDGLIGDIVRELVPGTDASRVALLGSVLAFAGVYVPGKAHWKRMNTTSPFIALVGESGIGGKGTAMTRARSAFASVWPEIPDREIIIAGLNSGEALVKTLDGRRRFSQDAMALLYEPEYGRMLVSRQREGSSIDFMMRLGFDGDDLSNHKVSESVTVTPPYWLSALVGITPSELGRRLEPGALQSGSANRWLYIPVRRRENATDTIPRLSPAQVVRLRDARDHVLRVPNPLELSPAVLERLNRYGQFLAGEHFGTMAELTRRLDVLAMRIALIHAIVERQVTVEIHHLERALALTEYARRGLSWVFTKTLDDPIAELIYRHLLDRPLTNRQISRDLCRDATKRTEAIDLLRRYRLAEPARIATRGRTKTVLQVRPEAVAKPTFVAFGHVTDAGQKPEADPSGTFDHVFANANENEFSNPRTPSRTEGVQKPDVSGTERGRNDDGSGHK